MTADSPESALDAVHAALVQGDLLALPALAERVERMVDDVAASDPATAARLRDKARRNGALLDAAARGLRAAHRRLEELRGAAGGRVATYDGAGRRQMLAPEGRLAGRF